MILINARFDAATNLASEAPNRSDPTTQERFPNHSDNAKAPSAIGAAERPK